MPENHSQPAPDEMTPSLRKALIEIGALIPRTVEEVDLAEAMPVSPPSCAQIDASFSLVLSLLDGSESAHPLMQLNETVPFCVDSELAIAARNGTELDSETLAKVGRDITNATRKSAGT